MARDAQSAGRGQRTWVKEESMAGPLFSDQKVMLQELEWWY